MNQFLHASRGENAVLDRVVAITVIAGRSFLESTVAQAFSVDSSSTTYGAFETPSII